MNPPDLQAALANITAESDSTLKHLKLASLCTRLFQERGTELVVVGGSAIEFYTEGAYTSGDVDLCVAKASEPLTTRARQHIMGQLEARGGPRSWQVCGSYVDVLGDFENLARTPVRAIRAPFGDVRLAPLEELIVERVLISYYPQDFPPARQCAIKLIAAALLGEVDTDWPEVRRLAALSAYDNWPQVKALIDEQAQALQIGSPGDSHA